MTTSTIGCLVVGTVFLAAVISGSWALCTPENVQACLAEVLTFNLSERLIPKMDDEKLDRICLASERMKTCMAPIRDLCYYLDQLQYDSLAATLDYLCITARTEFVEHRGCLERPNLDFGSSACYRTYQTKLAEAQNSSQANTDAMYDQMCRSADEYLLCMHRLVDNHCIAEAALWQWGYDYVSLEPLLDFLGCNVSDPRGPQPTRGPWDPTLPSTTPAFYLPTPHPKCTQLHLDKCIQPLVDAGAVEALAIVPVLEIKHLLELCDIYQKVEECLVDVKPYCTEDNQLVFEGIEKLFDSLCGRQRKEYITHMTCYSEERVHTHTYSCFSTFDSRLAAIPYTETQVYVHQRVCEFADDCLQCVHIAVESFCSSPAADWYSHLTALGLTPLLDKVNCTVHNDRILKEGQTLESVMRSEQNSRSLRIGLGIGGAVLVVGVVIAVVILLRRRRDRPEDTLGITGELPYSRHHDEGGMSNPVDMNTFGNSLYSQDTQPQTKPPLEPLPDYDDISHRGFVHVRFPE